MHRVEASIWPLTHSTPRCILGMTLDLSDSGPHRICSVYTGVSRYRHDLGGRPQLHDLLTSSGPGLSGGPKAITDVGLHTWKRDGRNATPNSGLWSATPAAGIRATWRRCISTFPAIQRFAARTLRISREGSKPRLRLDIASTELPNTSRS